MGTLGWWVFGWAFAYGSQGTPANGFIGTDGFFGIGFYTIDATTGVISPLASCDADGCQSTMLSWFLAAISVGLLYCRCDHRERWRGGACEEPHLRGVRLLYGELYLPDHRRMVVGRRLLGHHHLSWLHGFRGQRGGTKAT